MERHNHVRLLPNTKRLKQLIKAHGEVWLNTAESTTVQALGGPGVYIASLDGQHERWVRPEDLGKTSEQVIDDAVDKYKDVLERLAQR